MQFSNTTTKAGILQQIEFRANLGDAGITSDATLLLQMTGQVNDAYMKATQIIITADGIWRWDDANHTNLPTATTDLVTDQTDYEVMSEAPDTDQDWLEPVRVEFKDSGGTWGVLRKRDLRDVGYSITQDRTVASTPSTYYWDGSQIFLDAKPSYDSTGGLKIWFNRAPLEFASTDTTKRPGFNTLFHEYLVLKPTYWWEKYKGVGNPEQTKRDIQEMERDMASFYGNRSQDVINKLRRPLKSYK